MRFIPPDKLEDEIGITFSNPHRHELERRGEFPNASRSVRDDTPTSTKNSTRGRRNARPFATLPPNAKRPRMFVRGRLFLGGGADRGGESLESNPAPPGRIARHLHHLRLCQLWRGTHSRHLTAAQAARIGNGYERSPPSAQRRSD